MGSLAPVVVGPALIAMAFAQAPDEKEQLAAIAQRLTNPKLRPAAMHDLARAGGPGVRVVLAAFLKSAKIKDPAATTFAQALADLGSKSSHVLDTLAACIAQHDEPHRSLLLRALSNGALFASEGQRATILAATKRWAAAGLLYSPSAEEPTFAWYEYVRLVRRLALAEHGLSADAITAAMSRLKVERGMGLMFLPAQHAPKPQKHGHCAIESFGAHGQREMLEGIAELIERCPEVTVGVLGELTSYLRYSPPRSPRTRVEHCAGIGENAPNALPGVQWPTKWLYDEWHFACASAVLARSKVRSERELALRHLLHASRTTVRLRAIEDVRQWPHGKLCFVPDLKECLKSEHRLVVRAAALSIAQSPELRNAAGAELRQLADGSDRELAAIARRALKQR